jgi:hypothetical protein
MNQFNLFSNLGMKIDKMAKIMVFLSDVGFLTLECFLIVECGLRIICKYIVQGRRKLMIL